MRKLSFLWISQDKILVLKTKVKYMYIWACNRHDIYTEIGKDSKKSKH